MVDKVLLGIVIQETGRLVTGLLNIPRIKHPPVVEAKSDTPPQQPVIQEYDPSEKIKKGVACLPCTNSHLLTCRGLLDEAHRMSHAGINMDGLERVDQCLGEIAAAERVDLAPANIAQLPTEEQVIARHAAEELRNIRHDLEGVTDPAVLERAAAKTTELQKHVATEYMRIRLAQMSPEDKEKFNKKLKQAIREADEEIGG